MATTLGSAHGEERKCANCGLTYRYPMAKTFSCACGHLQPWDGWPGKNTKAGESSGHKRDPLEETIIAHNVERMAVATLERPPIDLHAVHATLNQMSADGLRQLHDRLAILQMVAVANEADDPEYYARVRQALAGAGVRF